MSSERIPRAPFLLLGAAALLAGLWAGLARIGWAISTPPSLVASHGPLMVCGFLGTVIALERAVALRRPWGFAAPALAGLGSLAVLAGLAPAAGAALLTLASAVVVAIFVAVLRIDRGLHHLVMTAAAASWLLGNALWLVGRPVFDVVPAWMGFLVLTIVGERLELTRLMPQTPYTRGALLVAAGALLVGIALGVSMRDAGLRLAGAAMLAMSLWLFRFDIARKTIRQAGLPRFIAACLLAGYAWLGLGGALALAWGNPVAGPRYDAILHAVFVGFVFSMIFGHAPVILPAVARVRLDFRRRFYLHTVLLHASLAARLAGDLAGEPLCRKIGGLANALAVVLFIASTALAVQRRRREVRGAAAARA